MNTATQFFLIASSYFGILFFSGGVQAYPLDGAETSGIQRLLGYQAAQQQAGGAKLPSGALLHGEDIVLHLDPSLPDFDQLPTEPALQSAIEYIFKQRDPSYSVVVVDISQPDQIAWAALRPNNKNNVGSVGKIVTMLGLFDTLATMHPDIKQRQEVLRTSLITAGDWININEHEVPHYNPTTGRNRFGLVAESDQFVLSEWVDHMISPSANAAGSVVWRETMLLKHFADDYPPTDEARREFLRGTSKKDLGLLAAAVSDEPLQRAGFDLEQIRQGSFWTRDAKNKVPGGNSYATPLELARLIYRMEQGKLVDTWSSLEMKRYLYMTKRRYRYVYAPELNSAAVYFKSGSLYQCQAEEGFRCRKYMGNKTNRMNSVTLVESPPGAEQPYRYIVALVSNVLKVNSAWDHSRLAAAIHQAVLTRDRVKVQEEVDEKTLEEAGKS